MILVIYHYHLLEKNHCFRISVQISWTRISFFFFANEFRIVCLTFSCRFSMQATTNPATFSSPWISHGLYSAHSPKKCSNASPTIFCNNTTTVIVATHNFQSVASETRSESKKIRRIRMFLDNLMPLFNSQKKLHICFDK